MPFHPCGSKWDWARFTYKSFMRLGPGMSPIQVRWVRADRRAPWGSSGHGFTSRFWENDWRIKADDGQVGELFGIRPEWYNGQPTLVDQCFKGPTWSERYREGVKEGEQDSFPALKLDAQGFPLGCCSAAAYYDLYPRCESLYRWPRKIRLRGVNNVGIGWCPTMVASDITMSLTAEGWYEGEGFWEPGHVRVRAAMGEPFPFDLPCSVRFYFLDHPPSAVTFQLAQNIFDARWLTEDYGVRVLGPTQRHSVEGFNPCGGGVFLENMEWDIIADLQGG